MIMDNDPFGDIIPLCYISPSQERLLSLDEYALSPGSEASVGFGIGSLEISPEANDDGSDDFQTPPEEAVPAASDGESVAVAVGVGAGVVNNEETVVDLGSDDDLGVLEADVAEKKRSEEDEMVSSAGKAKKRQKLNDGAEEVVDSEETDLLN